MKASELHIVDMALEKQIHAEFKLQALPERLYRQIETAVDQACQMEALISGPCAVAAFSPPSKKNRP